MRANKLDAKQMMPKNGCQTMDAKSWMPTKTTLKKNVVGEGWDPSWQVAPGWCLDSLKVSCESELFCSSYGISTKTRVFQQCVDVEKRLSKKSRRKALGPS